MKQRLVAPTNKLGCSDGSKRCSEGSTMPCGLYVSQCIQCMYIPTVWTHRWSGRWLLWNVPTCCWILQSKATAVRWTYAPINRPPFNARLLQRSDFEKSCEWADHDVVIYITLQEPLDSYLDKDGYTIYDDWSSFLQSSGVKENAKTLGNFLVKKCYYTCPHLPMQLVFNNTSEEMKNNFLASRDY